MTEGWWIGGSVLPRTPWTMIYRMNKGGLNRWWWYYRTTVCGNRRARNNSLWSSVCIWRRWACTSSKTLSYWKLIMYKLARFLFH